MGSPRNGPSVSVSPQPGFLVLRGVLSTSYVNAPGRALFDLFDNCGGDAPFASIQGFLELFIEDGRKAAHARAGMDADAGVVANNELRFCTLAWTPPCGDRVDFHKAPCRCGANNFGPVHAVTCVVNIVHRAVQAVAGSARRYYGFSAKTVMVGFPPPISGAIWL